MFFSNWTECTPEREQTQAVKKSAFEYFMSIFTERYEYFLTVLFFNLVCIEPYIGICICWVIFFPNGFHAERKITQGNIHTSIYIFFLLNIFLPYCLYFIVTAFNFNKFVKYLWINTGLFSNHFQLRDIFQWKRTQHPNTNVHFC